MLKIPPDADVKIRHLRYIGSEDDDPNDVVVMTRGEFRRKKQQAGLSAGILPHGGVTQVTVTLPDGRRASGEAVCSRRENYSRALGRMIAIGRALKGLE